VRAALAAAVVAVGAPLVLAVALVAGVAGVGSVPATPTAAGRAEVPAAYLALYEQAAASCPGLGWEVLAGIGSVESDHGRAPLPGVGSGANLAGAAGPMQLEPATFALYDHPVPADPTPTPGGTGSVYDPADAVWAAARMLCASGAGDPGRLSQAVYAQNHSPVYVAQVLAVAAAYASSPAGQPGTGAGVAVAVALGEVGTPYVWGGDAPGGFDCSGLVQWAYARAGTTLPRTAQAQSDAGPPLGPGTPLQAGDLVFFGAGPGAVDHVGIYVGGGRMVDAPHAGAQVRVEPVAGFTPPYVGATRPSP